MLPTCHLQTCSKKDPAKVRTHGIWMSYNLSILNARTVLREEIYTLRSCSSCLEQPELSLSIGDTSHTTQKTSCKYAWKNNGTLISFSEPPACNGNLFSNIFC